MKHFLLGIYPIIWKVTVKGENDYSNWYPRKTDGLKGNSDSERALENFFVALATIKYQIALIIY